MTACLSASFAHADGFIVIHEPPTPVPVPRGHFSLAPLEDSFHNVSVEINGKMQEAKLLPADKARSIYEDIVRRSKDPALLE